MGNFNRGGDRRSFGGGGSRGGGFGGGSRGGYNDRNRGGGGGDREMFSATCDSCGKTCELPFKPTGSRPVYCSDCFKKQDSGGDRRNDSRDRQPSRDARPSAGADFSGINAKLDKIIELLSAQAPKATPKQKKEAVKEVLAEEILVTPDEKVMTEEIIPEAAEVIAKIEAKKPAKKSKKAETTPEVPSEETTE